MQIDKQTIVETLAPEMEDDSQREAFVEGFGQGVKQGQALSTETPYNDERDAFYKYGAHLGQAIESGKDLGVEVNW